MTRKQIFLAVLPLWKNLDHPLVQYEIRQLERPHEWRWLISSIMGLTLLILLVALLSYGFSWQVVGQGVLGGLAVYLILLRLRLFVAVSGRAARMITVRRERGDWDLILITPIPKARWLELQLTAISWQVWPLVRNLMIGQAVFTGVALLYMSAQQHQRWQGEKLDDFLLTDLIPDAHYLPTWMFFLVALPFCMMVICLPLIEIGVFSTAALCASICSKNPSFALFRSFGNTMKIHVGSSANILFGLPLLLTAFGLFFHLGDGFVVTFVLLMVVGILGWLLHLPICFFTWNWLPWLAVWGLTLEVTYLSHALIFWVCLGFFAFAFGFLPLDGMSRAAKQALTHMARR